MQFSLLIFLYEFYLLLGGTNKFFQSIFPLKVLLKPALIIKVCKYFHDNFCSKFLPKQLKTAGIVQYVTLQKVKAIACRLKVILMRNCHVLKDA